MKTIKLLLTGTLALFICISAIKAQDYKVNANNVKKIRVLEVPAEFIFIPASGSELIIESTGYEMEVPPKRADGLKSLTSTAVDNTGLGLEVTNEGGIITGFAGAALNVDATNTYLPTN